MNPLTVRDQHGPSHAGPIRFRPGLGAAVSGTLTPAVPVVNLRAPSAVRHPPDGGPEKPVNARGGILAPAGAPNAY